MIRQLAKPKIDHPAKLSLAGLLALAAAYIFASLAIDRGNLMYYALAIAAGYIGLKYLWHAARGIRK